MKIEIHHPNGHVTKAPVILSEAVGMVRRIEEDEKYLADLMENIYPQLAEGTQVYLVIESKANNEHQINRKL